MVLMIDRRRSQVAERRAMSSRGVPGIRSAASLQLHEAVIGDIAIHGVDDPIAIPPREGDTPGLVASEVELSSPKRATSIQCRPPAFPILG